MRPKLIVGFFAAALALTFFAGLYSCGRTVKNEAYYQQISQYIYAFTNGTIGRNEPVRVRFVNAAVSAEQVGTSVASGVFSISPSVKGTPVWEDDRTILLKPEEALKYGQKYNCVVEVGRIYKEAPTEAKSFDFSFHIRELNFEVITDGIQTPDASNLRNQQIAGVIRSNDPIAQEELEKVLNAAQNGRALNVTWNHTDNNKTHYFVVNGVERTMQRSAVKLSWDGSSVGVSETGTESVPVPGLDEFEALSVRVDQNESQCILVNFSDPLSSSQSYAGLVSVKDYGGSFRYSADGNFLRIYPSDRITGQREITVESGVKNAAGARMRSNFTKSVNFEDIKPAVRLVGRGAVIPGNNTGSVIFPFEAVGLNAINVEIFKIYNSNILQYLQVNEIEGDNELERVGKIIVQKKIALSGLRSNASSKVWQRYALDLKDMIRQDPSAIYQVRISFDKSYVTNLSCATEDKSTQDEQSLGQTDDYGNLKSLWGGYRGIYWDDEGEWWDDEGYDYDRRETPCSNEYYNNEHFTRRNVFVSDLGLTAKRGKDGSVLAVVTDLNTTAPVGGVQIEYFNYQLQPIAKTTTLGDGTAFLDQTRDKPFIMVARQGERRGYLRMADGGTLSLSRFDVAGVESQKGLKGYIYGERGVWRPGDSVFLDFVLEDRTGKLPAGHPVNFELMDSKGALRYRTVVSNGVNGVYPIHFATSPDAPTGNWTAKVDVGGAKFTKALKIETVKPNRLKIDLAFPSKSISVEDDVNANLMVQWLHGATAKNLKAKVDMQVRTAVSTFPNFKNFVFEDPARSFYSEEETLFDGTLDDAGKASVPISINVNDQAPGKLIAYFKIRAFEQGGDFSSDNTAIDYYPFPRMVGVKVPTDKYGNKQMAANETGTVEVSCVDNSGKPLARKKVEVGLYRCDWRWWWDEDRSSNVGQFNSATHVNAIERATLTTDANGRALWKVTPTQWGRYMIRVTDVEGGHAAGDFFWSGYPDRLDDLYSRNAVAMLPLAADKEKYNVGETVSIKVPASEIGRVLVTLENGQRVVKHLWFDAKPGDNILTFKAEPEMAPAVYAHISLLQPHAQTKNDLPIRMYGVVPVNVENPATRLQPDIEMADVIKPGEPFTVKLREHGGQACAYTLAIVDEGLLDLTRFQTPNPHDEFYAREALGVKSWDIYDYVLGAYGVELERILSVGGDAFNRKAKNAAQVNRFRPAVIHVGPFYLEKGKTASHTLKIENYVGAVRVMAVMSAPAPNGKGAYGSAEKSCPVRKPLMILPTLPRVLGPGETVRLPIQVFAMEKQVKNATIRIKEPSGKVTITGAPTQTLTFSEPGDQIAYFDLKVGNVTGPAKFTFEVQGGGEVATDVIDIMVRNPMPYVTSSWQGTIEPGKEWSSAFDATKYADINSAALEVSALPPMNLSRHLNYLIRYPHGCTEQISSTGFAQLFADAVTPVSPKQQAEITKNITAAINKLCNRQDFSGGIAYWPGGQPEVWASTYAGHFLLEAKAKGYAVPENVINQWVRYQTEAARGWYASSSKERWAYHDNELNQAYRLYSLAIAGKPAIADMNRLREMKELYTETAYMLASAYAQSGKPEVARELLGKPWKEQYSYDWCGYTYGSDLRDRALILEAYTLTGDNARAEAMVNYIASILSDEENSWYWNTQSLATAMRALSRYATKSNISGPAYSYKLGNSGLKNGDSSRPVSVASITESINNANQIMVKNNGSVKLYARLVVSGQGLPGVETATVPSNLKIAVRYTTPQGADLDIRKVAQGTDFVAVVTVSRNTKYSFPFNELALTQIFPSGWEISNSRMGNFVANGNSVADFQDIRDDRVLTYFDLYGGSDAVRTYRVQLNAAYKGRYFLPSVQCEAMYDNRIYAGVPGSWVEVI